jgi:hypothetical protein
MGRRGTIVVVIGMASATALAGCPSTDLLHGGAPPLDAATRDAGDESDARDDADGASDLSLVGHWTFDETGGTKAADSSGRARDAILASGAAFSPGGGRYGGAVTLAAASFVSVDLGGSFPSSGTLSIWFRWDVLDGDGLARVFDDYDSKRGHIFVRRVNGAPETDFQIAYQPVDLTNGAYAWSRHFEVPRNVWKHLVATWNASTKSGVLVLDGAGDVATPYKEVFSGFVPDQQQFRFGGGLVGAIDEVRLYDRALSLAEAAALP